MLGQLNLNSDGSIRINEGLLSIGEKTYIKDGVIKKSMIGKAQIDTAHIKEIDASQANIFNLNVNNINGLDANFIKSKIELAFIEWMKGKVISAQNDAMKIDLNAGQINYYTDKAALKRVLAGYPNQFVKFATGTVVGKGLAGVTIIGSNRYGSESTDDGGFVGIRAWNGPNIDQVDIVGDTVRLTSSPFKSADGWDVITLPSKLAIDAHNASDRPGSLLNIGDVRLYKNANTYTSLKAVLNQFNANFKHLINITGRGDVILTWDSI